MDDTAHLSERLEDLQSRYSSWLISPRDAVELDVCIDLGRALLRVRDVCHANAPSVAPSAQLLGRFLCSRGSLLSSLPDVDEGLELLHTALTASDSALLDGPPSVIWEALHDLASALHARWDLAREIDDLDASIELRRLALREARNARPDHLQIGVQMLATSLFIRFAHFPRIFDLDEVIALEQEAVGIGLHTSRAAHFGALCTLAQSLMVKWDYIGDKELIERSVSLLRQALALDRCVDAKDYAYVLNSLSEVIQTRIHISDNDLAECVQLDTNALSLISTADDRRLLSLAALATTRLVHFTVHNDIAEWFIIDDLRRQIKMTVGRLDCCSAFYCFHTRSAWAHLQRLAAESGGVTINSLFRQALYTTLAEDGVMERWAKFPFQGIYLRRWVQPRPTLCKLALSKISISHSAQQGDLRKKALHVGSVARLCRNRLPVSIAYDVLVNHRSIPMYQSWLQDRPKGDPWGAAIRLGLSEELIEAFYDSQDEGSSGASDMLRAAIDNYKQAMELQVECGDSGAHTTMAEIANTYLTLIQNGGGTSVDLIDSALDYAQRSLTATPKGFPRELRIAADAYVERFRTTHREEDIEAAIDIIRDGLLDKSQLDTSRLHLADFWVDFAEELQHASMLDACSARLDSLAAVVINDLHPTSLMSTILLGGSDFLPRATDYSMTRGHANATLDMLNRGRGLIWTQLLRFQQLPLSTLRRISHNYAKQLEIIMDASKMERDLEYEPIGSPGSSEHRSYPERPHLPMLNAPQRHQRLIFDWTQLTAAAYRSAGIPRNTLPRGDSILDKPDIAFPVVVLNAGATRCDALLLRGRTQSVQQLALASCPRLFLDQLVQKLHSIVREDQDISRSARHFQKRPPDTRDRLAKEQDLLSEILRNIWDAVVYPVFEALRLKPTSTPPRVWWYPTGPFWQIPLHAAGKYSNQDQISAQDFAVSTYLPALNASKSHERSKSPKRALNVLAVCQTNTRGYASLPNVVSELEAIKRIAATSGGHRVTAITENHATVATISNALPSADLVHFASHGHQDLKRPLESALILSDGVLKVSTLIEMDLPRAEVAFLSACETATGDLNAPEETIHLAAAMLFVGFRGAIGTMWRIADCDGPPVAEETYRYLFSRSTFDAADAAYAIHEATKKLRQRRVHPIRWALQGDIHVTTSSILLFSWK